MAELRFDIAEGKSREELAGLYREKNRALGRALDEIKQLRSALTRAVRFLPDGAAQQARDALVETSPERPDDG